MAENSRGGKRKGAGRKPKYTEGTRKISVILPESLAAWVESQDGKTISDVVIEALERQRKRKK